MAECQCQPGAGQGGERQRVVGGVLDRYAGHAGAVRAECPGDALVVDGVALEDQQGVEEDGVSGDALDVGESEVAVVEEGGLLGLEPGEQVPERLRGTQPYADRQGVDEEADHGLDAGNVGVAAGDGGTEDDVRAAGQSAEQDGPQALEHGTDGQPVGPGGGGELFGVLLGEFPGVPLGLLGRKVAGIGCEK